MPPVAVGAGLAAGGIASGAMGANAQANAADSAANTAANAANRFYQFNTPDVEQMKLQLQNLVAQGQITPEMQQAILQNPSALDQIVKEDPLLRNSDLQALNTLSNISGKGGNDAQAQLGIQQAMNQAGAANAGATQANLQNAAQRGVAGSGLEFVSNQMAGQNAYNQAQMSGLQNAAAANQRALSALAQQGQLTGQMNNQDLQRQTAIGNARNDINRFNALTQQDVQRANVQAQNQAQAANLAEKQRISDYNTQLGNAQQQYNKQLSQQDYNNQLERARGAAGLAGLQSGAAMAQGQASANLWGGIGKGLTGFAGSIYANQPKSTAAQAGSAYYNQNQPQGYAANPFDEEG